MKLDDTDPGWEWFQEKLKTMRKQEKKRKKELKEKQKEETAKKASKMEEGALVSDILICVPVRHAKCACS